MKKDIQDRSDIERVVTLFYDKVKNDKEIGFFFTQVVKINWETHLPVMCSFWENVLFFTGNYDGDPLTTHRNVHQKYRTGATHFQRWLALFVQSVDDLYEGAKAEAMKEHARKIAAVMLKNIDGG